MESKPESRRRNLLEHFDVDGLDLDLNEALTEENQTWADKYLADQNE